MKLRRRIYKKFEEVWMRFEKMNYPERKNIHFFIDEVETLPGSSYRGEHLQGGEFFRVVINTLSKKTRDKFLKYYEDKSCSTVFEVAISIEYFEKEQYKKNLIGFVHQLLWKWAGLYLDPKFCEGDFKYTGGIDFPYLPAESIIKHTHLEDLIANNVRCNRCNKKKGGR